MDGPLHIPSFSEIARMDDIAFSFRVSASSSFSQCSQILMVIWRDFLFKAGDLEELRSSYVWIILCTLYLVDVVLSAMLISL